MTQKLELVMPKSQLRLLILKNWNLRPETISCLVKAPTEYDDVSLVFRSH